MPSEPPAHRPGRFRVHSRRGGEETVSASRAAQSRGRRNSSRVWLSSRRVVSYCLCVAVFLWQPRPSFFFGVLFARGDSVMRSPSAREMRYGSTKEHEGLESRPMRRDQSPAAAARESTMGDGRAAGFAAAGGDRNGRFARSWLAVRFRMLGEGGAGAKPLWRNHHRHRRCCTTPGTERCRG